MPDKPSEERGADIWEEFLQVRVRAVQWLHDTVLLKDSEIAKAINVDVTEVFLMRAVAASGSHHEVAAGTQAAPLRDGRSAHAAMEH